MDSLESATKKIRLNGTDCKKPEDSCNNTNNLKQEDPLKIPGILETIFSNLDAASIKNARQVNPLWSVEGAKVLFSKCYVKIPSGISLQESSPPNEDMEKFKAFLSYKSSDVSMIPNITVDSFSDVKVWKSLGVLGPQVKSLKLEYIDEEANWLHNLFDLLPNLKYLNINNLLEKNNFNITKPFIINILTSVMSKMKKDTNPLVISSLKVDIKNREDLEDLRKFSDCSSIMIEKLQIFMGGLVKNIKPYKTRIANIISKLLSSSQNTMKELSIPCCDIILHLLDFPKLIKLTKMALEFHLKTSGHFHSTFRFLEKVPNLNDFDIEAEVLDEAPTEDFLATLFENTGTAPSVRKITMHTDPNFTFNFDPPFPVFPDAEEFDAFHFNFSQTNFHSLWKHGQNLRKLYLHLNVSELDWNLSHLDSFITGFTPETVEQIKNAPKWPRYNREDMEMLRVNPSILNLQELESFTIVLYRHGENYWPKRMLTVAAKFAFRLMPKDPDVTVFVTDRRSALECAREALDEVSKLPNFTVRFTKSPR